MSAISGSVLLSVIIHPENNIMGLMNWLWEHHQFLMHQCFLFPFAFLLYFLAKHGYLSLTNRYVYKLIGSTIFQRNVSSNLLVYNRALLSSER